MTATWRLMPVTVSLFKGRGRTCYNWAACTSSAAVPPLCGSGSPTGYHPPATVVGPTIQETPARE
ncbi:MAG TPA: hypothetical protein VK689_08595 [Armatimonadota bacterium]|nr:hypothetical protein [Armatimonadota bacterium]